MKKASKRGDKKGKEKAPRLLAAEVNAVRRTPMHSGRMNWAMVEQAILRAMPEASAWTSWGMRALAEAIRDGLDATNIAIRRGLALPPSEKRESYRRIVKHTKGIEAAIAELGADAWFRLADVAAIASFRRATEESLSAQESIPKGRRFDVMLRAIGKALNGDDAEVELLHPGRWPRPVPAAKDSLAMLGLLLGYARLANEDAVPPLRLSSNPMAGKEDGVQQELRVRGAALPILEKLWGAMREVQIERLREMRMGQPERHAIASDFPARAAFEALILARQLPD